jgi:glycosyltransferase involved in cell wall biosynthesis
VSAASAELKVSVIVPVFNPGRRIDDCVRSLLDQSLPASEYEVIFVDDGSTDATPELLDRLAAAHAHVRVEHIPNSGWPGRPRNVGIELARGEFVYFVDNDDWLGREALERMHAMALHDEADIVIGKVVGHGKSVPRNLFRRNRSGVDLEWDSLVWLLTPHKLFRRAFVEAHGLRFPEGRRRLEDHVFVMRAYFASPRISVLADYPCYHWILWSSESNASWGGLDPQAYFANMREVLDIVDEHTEPGPFRDRLYARWYRGKMLNRVEKVHPNPDLTRRRRLYEEMHKLAVERIGPGVDAFLPFNLQLRSAFLRAADYDSLAALAGLEIALRPAIRVTAVRARAGGAEVEFEAQLESGDGPLLFARDGRQLHWLPPATLSPAAPVELLDATAALDNSTVQVLLKQRSIRAEYRVPAQVQRRLVTRPDGHVAPALSATAQIQAAEAAAGAPLPSGIWEVHAVVIIAGFRAVGQMPLPRGEDQLLITVHPDGRVTAHRQDWQRRLGRRLPHPVTRAIRKTQLALSRRRR